MVIHANSKNRKEIEALLNLIPKRLFTKLTTFKKGNGLHCLRCEINLDGLEKAVNAKKQDLKINTNLVGVIGIYRNAGMSFQDIANKMNEEGYTNSRGNALNKMQVSRLYKQYQIESKALL